MIQKIKLIFNLFQNMGLRYVLFRVYYVISTKFGWQKKAFPTHPKFKGFITIEGWRNDLPPFFFYGKNIHNLPKEKDEKLKITFENIKNGNFIFFSKQEFNLGKDYDWITNPSTGFQYDINKHWSEIQDLSIEAGDIKYVWEKARFSYLYDIIRYDYHFEDDQSQFVFSEIEDFIDKNPINKGPNYKCSQEMSLRLLNWTFALYFYKDSIHLNNVFFKKIINAIYWHLHHIYINIHFSRIAVRNNHAITETLTLYLSAKLFPFIPEVKKWSRKAKKWFEKEVEYQIYKDGTFLQFSMNYHRVVVQLLTWGIRLAQLNKDSFKTVVYDRAKKSLEFLDACSDEVSGNLPNYGSNDGALFFKLNNDDYRNYRSQLDDLRLVLNKEYRFESESAFWYGLNNFKHQENHITKPIHCFNDGGYYIFNDKDVKTFIRCGQYKDRPFQSDNLHIDIWINGLNILRDSGSYKYNTDKALVNYFNGCEAHNTLSIEGKDQMLKGNRFIWYNWVKEAKASLHRKNNEFIFNGRIRAFKALGNKVYHNRKVVKEKNINIWNVTDEVINITNVESYQYWHINPELYNLITIKSKDKNGVIEPTIEEKWYSGYYGVKEKSIRLTFATNTNRFNTQIKINL